MIRVVSSIAAVMLAAASGAAAQTTGAAGAGGAPDPDRAAVATTVMSAVKQVKLCDLAIERSSNAEVKTLCRKVSADSARTALAGMQLASVLGATEIKLEPPPDTSAELESLGEYSGSDFDRQFLLGQIEGDESDENSVRYAAEFAIDASVRRYENSLLPKIERHLLLAENALLAVSEAMP